MYRFIVKLYFMESLLLHVTQNINICTFTLEGPLVINQMKITIIKM